MSELMMNFGVGCFDFLTAINIILIMQMFFGTGFFRKKWQQAAFVGGFVLVHILMYTVFAQNGTAHFLLNYGYLGAAVLYLSPKRRVKTLFLLIPGILVYVQWTFLVGMIKEIMPWEFATIPGSSLGLFELVTDLLLAGFLIWGIWWCKQKTGLRPISVGETIFLCLFCLISPFFIEIMELLVETRQNTFRQVVWTLFVVAVTVLVFYAIIHRRNARYYKDLSGSYRAQFADQYSFFKQYKEEQQDVIRFRHDWKNHLQVLTTLFEKGDYEKAGEYFDSLSDGMKQNSAPEKTFSGNEVVDIILAAKAEQMAEAGIKMECNGGLEHLHFMEAVDCCILFSNLIDNAVEANMTCASERFVRIKSAVHPGHVVVSVENPMEGTLNRTEDGLATTKDGKYHGIGTGNIISIIKKYGGEYEILANSGQSKVFSIRMLFPLS